MSNTSVLADRIKRPVSRAHRQAGGLGPAFVQYVASTWPRFVADA